MVGFICPFCQMMFDDSDTLDFHIRGHEEVNYKGHKIEGA